MYHIGTNITKYINVYLSFKLNILKGKTIILCNNEDEIYKLELFLNRCKFNNVNIIIPKYSKNMKTYVCSIFNSGICQILITTNQLLEDLDNKKIG